MKRKRESGSLATFQYAMIAGLLLGIAALSIYLALDRLRQHEASEWEIVNGAGEARFDGVIPISAAIDAPDYALVDQHGETFQLRGLRGRFALLTFGFTNCPDICPLTLSDFGRVKDLLGERAEDLAFVFISVDGRRDNPAVLRRYLAFRELDAVIGLTGDEDLVRAFGAPFGLSFEIQGDSTSGVYSVNHTAGSFLLDARGRWIRRFQFGAPPETIAAEILRLLPKES